MNFKFVFLCLVVFILGFGFVSAKDQSILINYNSSFGGSIQDTIDFSDFKLKVNTQESMTCKYDTSSGVSYGSMDEVFDLTGDKYHYVDFLELGDGVYKYYIKCKNSLNSFEPSEFEIVVRVNSLVSAQIVLSEEAPLKEGRVAVKLVTSKPVSNTPSLTYSFDGTTYKPIVLVGSSKNWEGSVVLDSSLKEGILSFKFSANDLEGRQGTEITVGSYFDYDLLKPVLITDIKAISDEGEIKLDWYYDDKFESFNVYRSEVANPDYTDFYKNVEKKEFVDTAVEKGKTYYYRVAAVDYAGNEADLSKEVSGTSLGSSSVVKDGLSAQLIGLVESFIIEINSLNSDLSTIESRISKFSDLEKEMFNALELEKKISSATSELDSIKNTAEKWKTQDLSREDLVSKIDSSRVRLEILEKDIPSDISVLNELSVSEDLSDSKKSLAIMELNGALLEKEIEKNIKETNKYILSNSVSVKSYFYDIEISYLDGKKDSFSVIKRKVSGEIEKMQNAYFVERIPSSIDVDFSNIKFRNRNYNEIKEESVFTFETDTKDIFYYIPKVSDLNDLKDVEFSFIFVNSGDVGSSGITGFSILGGSDGGYVGIVGGIILILILVYFGFFRGNYSDDYFRIINRINESRDAIEVKDYKKSREVYSGVKRIYSNLKKNEKKKIYPQLENLHNDILISEIEDDLFRFKGSKDAKLISKIELRVSSLSESKKNKVMGLLSKIKEEVNSSDAN